MESKTIRERIDAYTKEKYGIDPEILPFSHEDYEIYRHTDTGKWFAVFIVKERSAFGMDGDGAAEILCVKPRDRFTADFLMQQPGYLRGYPSRKWNWISMLLDGIVPFEDICRWLDESYLSIGYFQGISAFLTYARARHRIQAESDHPDTALTVRTEMCLCSLYYNKAWPERNFLRSTVPQLQRHTGVHECDGTALKDAFLVDTSRA